MRGLRRSGSADKALVSAIGSEATKLERYLANLLGPGPESDQEPLEVGGVTIDLFRRTVSRDGDEVHLTPKEYAVLAELAKHPGRVLTHAHLLRTAWGPAQEKQTEYLRVAVAAAAEARARPEATAADPQRARGRLPAPHRVTLIIGKAACAADWPERGT